MQHGETLQSFLPWDIPWWMPDHAVFFGVFYLVLLTLACGLGYAVFKSLKETRAEYAVAELALAAPAPAEAVAEETAEEE